MMAVLVKTVLSSTHLVVVEVVLRALAPIRMVAVAVTARLGLAVVDKQVLFLAQA